MQALPLFEIYQKNFDKYKNILSEMIESYQNAFSTQSKEKKSVLLKEMGLNLIKMESSITQMESQVIFELIPDEKKKLKDIIEKNRNIVKQYEREIKDLKNKEQSILNDNNMANNTKININKTKNKSNTYLNFLQKKDSSNENKILNESIDTMLFINNNNSNNNNNKNILNNETSNEEMDLQRGETIKRRNFEKNIKEKDFLNHDYHNENDIFLSNTKNNKNDNMKDKDKQDNKYKLNKANYLKKVLDYGIRCIKYILKKIIDLILVLYGKFIHYLRHKYGQAATNRIIAIFCAILFIIIYTIIIYNINKNKLKRGENIGILKNITETNTSIVKNSKIENNSEIINETFVQKKEEINTSFGKNSTDSEKDMKNETIVNTKTDSNNTTKENNVLDSNNNIDVNNITNLNNTTNMNNTIKENENNINNDNNSNLTNNKK